MGLFFFVLFFRQKVLQSRKPLPISRNRSVVTSRLQYKTKLNQIKNEIFHFTKSFSPIVYFDCKDTSVKPHFENPIDHNRHFKDKKVSLKDKFPFPNARKLKYKHYLCKPQSRGAKPKGCFGKLKRRFGALKRRIGKLKSKKGNVWFIIYYITMVMR